MLQFLRARLLMRIPPSALAAIGAGQPRREPRPPLHRQHLLRHRPHQLRRVDGGIGPPAHVVAGDVGAPPCRRKLVHPAHGVAAGADQLARPLPVDDRAMVGGQDGACLLYTSPSPRD